MAFLDNLVEKGIVKSSEINAILRETKDNDGDIDKSLEERGIDPGEISGVAQCVLQHPFAECGGSRGVIPGSQKCAGRVGAVL